MPLDTAACFNVPGIFSPHRLSIRYPSEVEVEEVAEGSTSQHEATPAPQVGEKRKRMDAALLEEEIAVNALVLASESEVFERLFTSELQGSEHPSVTVESAAEKDALVKLLHFCYTKTLPCPRNPDYDALLCLLILADRYGVAKAMKVIAIILQHDETVEGACRILDLPSTIKEQEPMRAVVSASKWVIQSKLRYQEKICSLRKFEGLSAEVMQLVLENPDLTVTSEQTVFAMVWAWAQGDSRNMLALPKLSKHIKFHQMTSSFLSAIQHLDETQSPEVAAQISSALLFLGIANPDSNGLQIYKEGGWACWDSYFKARDGDDCGRRCVNKASIPWVAAEASVRALADLQTLPVATKEACGYKLNCNLVRKCDELWMEVTCTLFVDLGPNIPLPVASKVETEVSIRSVQYTSPALLRPQGVISSRPLSHLKWRGEGTREKTLPREVFQDQKLEGTTKVRFV